GHAENGVHSLYHVAQRPRVQADENLSCVGNRVGREVYGVFDGTFQASVESHRLLAAVGDDFDLTYDDVRSFAGPFEFRLVRERGRQVELAEEVLEHFEA